MFSTVPFSNQETHQLLNGLSDPCCWVFTIWSISWSLGKLITWPDFAYSALIINVHVWYKCTSIYTLAHIHVFTHTHTDLLTGTHIYSLSGSKLQKDRKQLSAAHASSSPLPFPCDHTQSCHILWSCIWVLQKLCCSANACFWLPGRLVLSTLPLPCYWRSFYKCINSFPHLGKYNLALDFSFKCHLQAMQL